MNRSVPAIRTRVNAATISSKPPSPYVVQCGACVCVPAADWVMYPVWLWCAQWAREKSQQGTTSPLAPGPLHFINLSTGRGLPLDRNSFTHTRLRSLRERKQKQTNQSIQNPSNMVECLGNLAKQEKFVFVFSNPHLHRFVSSGGQSEQHPSRCHFICLYSWAKRLTTNCYLQYILFHYLLFHFLCLHFLSVCFLLYVLYISFENCKNALQISSTLYFFVTLWNAMICRN